MEEKPKNTEKQNFTPEQLKQLMSLQNNLAANQKAKTVASSQKIVMRIVNTIQTLQYYLDRFVNFTTKPHDADRNDVVQAARSPILFGTYVILSFVLVGGVWGSCAPLDSAAVAIGTLLPSKNKQVIIQQESGILANLFVAQGDKVKAGDKLLALEETQIKAHHDSVLNQYRHWLAMESRLIAERDDKSEIEFPEFLMKDKDIPEVARIIHTQESLFKSRAELFQTQKNSLLQQVEQYNRRIEGLEAKKVSLIKSLEVAKDRLNGTRTLLEKGFAQKALFLELEAKEAGLRSEVAVTEAEIASTKHAITESEIRIITLQNDRTEKTLNELRDTQVKVSSLKEEFTRANDSLSRVIIKSPVDGIVNVIHFHTIGSLVPSGNNIMEISPTNDHLIIEAKVPHKNIDSVHEGLVAKIRFSAFKSRTTPSFTGKVITISPDVVQDRNGQQGEPYYIARIEINMDEFNKIAKARNLELHPGMQAEVQIVTGTRTLLQYLLDPITDTMFRAFKEK
jgi:HlyD family secretion protein